jgi:hypothetical protein
MSTEPDNTEEPDFPPWPGDWPGRHFVDLDCLGDPGAWLDRELPSVEEILSADPQEDESMAEPLADAYIRAGEDLAFPLPTDFGLTRKKMREMAVADFVAFIREWRKRAQAKHP